MTGMRRGEAARAYAGATSTSRAGRVVDCADAVVGQARLQERPRRTRTRNVALDPATVMALRDHRRRQLEERLALGSRLHKASASSSSAARTARQPGRRASLVRSSATQSKLACRWFGPRPTPASRDAGARRWPASEGRLRATRPCWRRDHLGHLLARDPGDAGGRGGDGGGADRVVGFPVCKQFANRPFAALWSSSVPPENYRLAGDSWAPGYRDSNPGFRTENPAS